MATLHFFSGKAGAGKSTIAKDLAAREAATLICEDIWLARLFGDQMKTFDDYLRFAPKLKTVVEPLAVDLLHSGRNVVLDFPANTIASRLWFRSVFEQAGSSHVLHFVDTREELCLQRIGKRNVARPEGSHQLSEEDFMHVSSYFQAPVREEGFNVLLYPPC